MIVHILTEEYENAIKAIDVLAQEVCEIRLVVILNTATLDFILFSITLQTFSVIIIISKTLGNK